MSAGDHVNVLGGVIPEDYHCRCSFCQRTIGELRMPGGEYYNRLERREYYDPAEKGAGKQDKDKSAKKKAHIAKTPLHIARWAVQAYTEPGDWVLDPTIGAGTTAVEALTQGRSAAGMEVQYAEVLKLNLDAAKRYWAATKSKLEVESRVRIGDARRIGTFLGDLDKKFKLIVNNPPYSGDESMPTQAKEGRGPEHRDKETYFFYEKGLPNLAFLKEGPEYWEALGEIYGACLEHLEPGGHFVYGVKDMMRNKKPFMLHQDLNTLLTEKLGLDHVGTAFLKHNPRTQFLNTYFKFYGVHPAYYQTIGVFKKSFG